MFLKEYVDEYKEQLQRRLESEDGLLGLTTGYKELDKLIGGWGTGLVSYVGAPTSVGKTSFVLSVLVKGAKHLLKHYDEYEKPPVLVCFSLEMGDFVLLTRVLVNALADEGKRLNSFDLLRGAVKPEELELVQEGLQKLRELGGVLFMDFTSVHTAEFEKVLEGLTGDYWVPLVVIDYFGKIMDQSYDGSAVSRQGIVSAKLTQLAKAFNTHVLAVIDLNREGAKSKKPGLHNLRWGEAAAYDADLVILLHRPALMGARSGSGDLEDDDRYVEAIVAKNRHGPVGSVEFYIDLETGLYVPWHQAENKTEDEELPDKYVRKGGFE